MNTIRILRYDFQNAGGRVFIVSLTGNLSSSLLVAGNVFQARALDNVNRDDLPFACRSDEEVDQLNPVVLNLGFGFVESSGVREKSELAQGESERYKIPLEKRTARGSSSTRFGVSAILNVIFNPPKTSGNWFRSNPRTSKCHLWLSEWNDNGKESGHSRIAR